MRPGTPRRFQQSAYPYRGMRYSSSYVTMRDGVRIAIDPTCPRGLTFAARHPRSIVPATTGAAVALAGWTRGQPTPASPQISVVGDVSSPAATPGSDVDVRGSGRVVQHPRVQMVTPTRSGDGRRDRRLGRAPAGATERSLRWEKFVRRHVGRALLVKPASAVQVVRPRYSLFGVYASIAFGIHAAVLDTWGRYNEALDRNACTKWWVVGEMTGMQPVQEDRDRSRCGLGPSPRIAATTTVIGSLTFRDDIPPRIPIVANLTPGSSRSVHRSSRATSTGDQPAQLLA